MDLTSPCLLAGPPALPAIARGMTVCAEFLPCELLAFINNHQLVFYSPFYQISALFSFFLKIR